MMKVFIMNLLSVDPDFVCTICGKKLAAANTQAHAKRCHDSGSHVSSQFMLLNTDNITSNSVKKEEPKEEVTEKEDKPKEDVMEKEDKPEEEPLKEEETPKEDLKVTSSNPFDAPSEEEEEAGNPFDPEEVKVTSPNPFDNPSEEEEEESGNPFAAPEEKPKEEAHNPFDEEEKEQVSPLEQVSSPGPMLGKTKKQKSIFNMFRRDKDERKDASPSLFASLTSSITNTVNSIVSATTTPDEDPAVKAAREEEERKAREEAERQRREEEERIRKQREEEERKRREEEERIRKTAMIEEKLKAGIVCMKHCSRGKPHETTVSLITHSSGGRAVRIKRMR